MGRRIAVALAIGALGLGLSACGPAVDRATEQTVEFADAVSPEAGALAAMGFDVTGLGAAAPAPAPTPSGDAKGKRPAAERHKARVFLRRNTLHGEVVVKTDDGTKTVVVQRGTITAINDTSVTVKSSDGYSLTWTFGSPIHVIEHRTTIQASQLAVGTEVGVAGAKENNQTIARLVVVPAKK